MLSYKNKLQQASFRGVPFKLKEVTTVMGRRVITHEYPLRSQPYTEDLGKKAREFTFNAFVMTPKDYTASKALQAAFENFDTPGTLIHPTLGSMQVMVKDCTHRYSNDEGGIEYFSVTFVETLGNNYPNVIIDTQSLIRSSSRNLISTANTYFSSNFKTSGFPDFVSTSAIDNLEKFVIKFRSMINFGSARNGNPANYSRLIARVKQFEKDIPTLIADPLKLAETINDLNSDLNASFSDNLKLAMLIQSRLFEYGDGFILIIPITNLREVEKINQDQLIYLIKSSAIAMMVRNVSLMTFPSSEDAINTRDSIDTKAWSLIQTLANNFEDDIYTSLTAAITAMVQDVKIRSTNAASTLSFLIADSLPAKVLAYEYLGDATQDVDLIARNHIANPLFIAANSTIKIVQNNVRG